MSTRQHFDIYSLVTYWARHLGRHYIGVLIASVLLTSLSIVIISGLRFNSDLADLLPANHPDLKILRRIQAKYSTDTGFMVLLSKNHAFAADLSGRIHMHDGQKWIRQKLGPPLHALWGISAADLFAAGGGGKIFHFNGVRWQAQETNTRATLHGLWGSGPHQLFAVGEQGTIIQFNGRKWNQLPPATPHTLYAISGGSSLVLAVGQRGEILRIEANKVVHEKTEHQGDLYGVWVGKQGEAFAVGADGTWLERKAGSWRRLHVKTRATLRAVWGAGPDNIYAVGDQGTVLRFDGSSVKEEGAGATTDLAAVYGAGTKDLWIAGAGCTIRRLGDQWEDGPYGAAQGIEGKKWYSRFIPQEEEVCNSHFSAIWRPRADMDSVKALAPQLAAQLEKSPLISRVDFKKPIRFFKDHALFFSSVENLLKLQSLLEEALERETAQRTGLLVDFEEERTAEHQRELRALFTESRERTAAMGTSVWYSPPDGASIGLVVFPAQGFSDFEKLRQVEQEIKRIVRSSGYQRLDPQLRIDVGGDGTNKIREYDATIYDIFGTLWVPVVGIIILMGIYFRRVIGLFLVIIPLGMSICWTAAFTTLSIGTLNYVTGFLFAVLFGLGIDYGIQLYSRYREGRSAGLNPDDAMNHVILDTGRATLTSAFTTAIALLTMIFTDFRGFSEFGFISGIGVILALISFILVLPAMIFLAERLGLLRLPVNRAKATSMEIAPGQEPFRLPWVVLVVSLVLTGYGIYGATQIRFEYDHRKLRPERQLDEVDRRCSSAFGRSFTPTLLLANSRQELEAAVSAIRRRSQVWAERSVVGQVVSILDLVPERQREKKIVMKHLNQLLHDKRWDLVDDQVRERIQLRQLRQLTNADPFQLADLPVTIRRGFRGPGFGEIWLAMIFHTVDLGDSTQARALKQEVGNFEGDQWINMGRLLPGNASVTAEGLRTEVRCPPEDQQCITQAATALRTLRHQGHLVFSQVVSRKQAYQAGLTVDQGLRGELLAIAAPGYRPRPDRGTAAIQRSGLFHVSSGELVLAEVVEVLLHDGRIAFIVALFAVFIFAVIDFRSFKYAFLAILPLGVGFLWTFGLMAYLNLKLNMFNFVILPAMMGIGIDYGVHYVHRYRSEGRGNLGRVMRRLYWVIFFCAATTLMGFGNVAIASHPGLKSLGQLAIIGMACVFFASTYSLPAMLYAIEHFQGIRPLSAGTKVEGIVLYAASYCPSSRMVHRFLKERGVDFRCIEVDILPMKERQRLARELVQAAGVDALPVTHVGEQFLVGFNPAALGPALDAERIAKEKAPLGGKDATDDEYR